MATITFKDGFRFTLITKEEAVCAIKNGTMEIFELSLDKDTEHLIENLKELYALPSYTLFGVEEL